MPWQTPQYLYSASHINFLPFIITSMLPHHKKLVPGFTSIFQFFLMLPKDFKHLSLSA